MLKSKKAQELKNKLQTQIAKYNSQLKSKASFRQTQIQSLKKKYNSKSNDLVPQLENIVAADVYIAAVTDIINNLKILFQNPELLVDGKKLPSEIQVALEYCNAVGKVDKQPDLRNLIKGIMEKHKALTDISITHETYVYFGAEQITHEDVEKYFPEIKSECNLVEDQYLASALSKYSDLITVPIQTAQFPNPVMNQQFYQPQLFQQNLQQTAQFPDPNLLQTTQQVPQFTPQNLSQPPQFTPQNLSQPPQFQTQNLSQPPQFTPQNLSQPPQFPTQNLNQPPQFTPQNLSQPPQIQTQTLQQPPQFTPSNSQQSPYASSDSQPSQQDIQFLPPPAHLTAQNTQQYSPQNTANSTTDAPYQPPQGSIPPPFAPPPFTPAPTMPPQLSEVAGNMAYPQIPTIQNSQNDQGGN